MSQKKRKDQEDSPSETVSPPQGTPGHEYLRKALLGLITALLVARPLVGGEDPGLLAPQTGTSGLVLTLMWFFALLGWAIWRISSKKSELHGGVVEVGLLVATLAVAVSTAFAKYRHPAVLIAWEWLALFVALFLIRQLTTSESDRRHLLAALIASVVSLSSYAIYQYSVELPKLQQHLQQQSSVVNYTRAQERALHGCAIAIVGNGTQNLLPAVSLINRVVIEYADPATLDRQDMQRQLSRRLEENMHAFATFAHPNTFAGYLILFLPAMLVAIQLCYRRRHTGLQAILAGMVAIVVILALFLTHSRGALLGLAFAAGVVGLWLGIRGRIPLRNGLAMAVAAGVLVVVLLMGSLDPFLGKSRDTARNRVDYWSSTWEMIKEHPLGVGAGNFANEYPRYMKPGAYETIKDPHNFALEMWATAGVAALVGILIALGGFFWKSLLSVRASEAARNDNQEKVEVEGTEKPRWEFYLWGSIGLLLAYVLQRTGLSPLDLVRSLMETDDDVFMENFSSLVRALIWFAVFGLFAGIRWPSRLMSMALTVGIMALLINLCVSGGINAPSLALPLWVAIGLALAGLDLPTWKNNADSWFLQVAPLPLALGLFVAYVIYPFDPVTRGMGWARESTLAAHRLTEDQRSRIPSIRDGKKYLAERVALPLRGAVKEDPGNARWHVQMCNWYSEVFIAYGADQERGKPFLIGAEQAAKEAQRLDPHGSEAHKTMYQLQLRFAQIDRTPKSRSRWLVNAADAMRLLIKRDPTDPWNYYGLARILMESGNYTEAREAGETALYFDSLVSRPPRQLGDWQRILIYQWLQPRGE